MPPLPDEIVLFPPLPRVEMHGGIYVVRDDLTPGGTKARFLPALLNGQREVVYAGPREGGAAVAISTVGQRMGVKVTLFYAKANELHPRQRQAQALGANIVPVYPGYLSVVKARALAYCDETGATLLPFGLDTVEASEMIANVASCIGIKHQPFDEVWCAAGSGTLARGLRDGLAKFGTKVHAVEVGRALREEERRDIIRYTYPKDFSYQVKHQAPFPSDPHYDRKAWDFCRAHANGRALFWNVLGDLPA